MIDEEDQGSMITFVRSCVGIVSEAGVVIFVNDCRLSAERGSLCCLLLYCGRTRVKE